MNVASIRGESMSPHPQMPQTALRSRPRPQGAMSESGREFRRGLVLLRWRDLPSGHTVALAVPPLGAPV
jgi:hypothetical protein